MTSSIRVITFGDSNTDYGFDEPGKTQVAASYVCATPTFRLAPAAPHNQYQLAAEIEKQWAAAYPSRPLRSINHGIGGTSTGTGIGPTGGGGPNALESVSGVTRFEAECMGKGGTTWTYNGLPRVNAVVPTAQDYIYVSLGTNDCRYSTTYVQTIANLTTMMNYWLAAGYPASHFILATIPPTADSLYCGTNTVNTNIRALIAANGLSLLDLGAHCNAANGIDWIDPTNMSVAPPTDVHYRYAVRQWIAGQIVSIIGAAPTAGCTITAHRHNG